MMSGMSAYPGRQVITPCPDTVMTKYSKAFVCALHEESATDHFKQPSRFLGSHNPQYEIFYIYPASGRLDLPWSMQTVSFLCSLLVDGSTKTKLPGLICKTVAVISDLIPVFQNNFSRVHQSLLFARFICSVNTETQSSIKGSVLQSFGGFFF